MPSPDKSEPPCEATFFDAAEEPVRCALPVGHQGMHFDRGFSWVPDLRDVSVQQERADAARRLR